MTSLSEQEPQVKLEREADKWLSRDRQQKKAAGDKSDHGILTEGQLAYRRSKEVYTQSGVIEYGRENVLAPSPQAEITEREIAEAEVEREKSIFELVTKLDPKLRETVELRFGLNGYEPKTFQEIAAITKVSETRVRQRLNKAEAAIREGVVLDDFSANS